MESEDAGVLLSQTHCTSLSTIQEALSFFYEELERETQSSDFIKHTLKDIKGELTRENLNAEPLTRPAVYRGLCTAVEAFQEHLILKGSRLCHHDAEETAPLNRSWLTAMSKSLEAIVDGDLNLREVSYERLSELWRSIDFAKSVRDFFGPSYCNIYTTFFANEASLTWQTMALRMLLLLHEVQKSLHKHVFALGVVTSEPDDEYRLAILKPLDASCQKYNTILWVHVDNVVKEDLPTYLQRLGDPVSYNTWTGFLQEAMAEVEQKWGCKLLEYITEYRPSAQGMCKFLYAPPPWSALPFAEMQGITSEELLVFFPNHALTWPAICERLTWDFSSFAEIAHLVNKCAGSQINKHGIMGSVVTVAQVTAMIELGRREFRNWAFEFATPSERRNPERYIKFSAYGPPGWMGLWPHELTRAYSLKELADFARSNPMYPGIAATSTFTQKVHLAMKGYSLAQSECEPDNPPRLPDDWNYISWGGIKTNPDVGPFRSLSQSSTCSSTYTRHCMIKGDAKMSDLCRHEQNNPEALIAGGLYQMNGEIILFLRNRYQGGLSLQRLISKLKPNLTDRTAIRSLRKKLQRRVKAALEHQASLHGVSYNAEHQYWKNYLEMPEDDQVCTILPQGPPPRPIGTATLGDES